jgi:hypothetical protein
MSTIPNSEVANGRFGEFGADVGRLQLIERLYELCVFLHSHCVKVRGERLETTRKD